MSIVVNKVSKLYGNQKALDNVSFRIETGQIVGFLGPNGAGKSTLMKIITGFIPPTSGTVLVNGTDVMHNSLKVRRQIGYLPEHNPQYLEMYVKEFLLFSAGSYGMKQAVKKQIEQIIERTGLSREQHKKIGALSKGYRQRVGLAQAFLHNPQVLILDEPTTGLDPNQIIEIRNLISEIARNKTVMLSTHIMQEVEAICDRVIIIDKGKIVANDTTENVVKLTNHETITILVELDKPTGNEAFENLTDVIRVKQLQGNQYLIEAKTDIRAQIFQLAVLHKLTVLSMQKKEQSLESVFQSLTQ